MIIGPRVWTPHLGSPAGEQGGSEDGTDQEDAAGDEVGQLVAVHRGRRDGGRVVAAQVAGGGPGGQSREQGGADRSADLLHA